MHGGVYTTLSSRLQFEICCISYMFYHLLVGSCQQLSLARRVQRSNVEADFGTRINAQERREVISILYRLAIQANELSFYFRLIVKL
jgi:hypothetical protein